MRLIKMLVEYATKTRRFMNLLSDMPVFVPVVASGMAVKMYSDQFFSSSNFYKPTIWTSQCLCGTE
jgi:hypothetical protein